MSCAIDNAELIHICIESAAFTTDSSEISRSGMGGRGLNHIELKKLKKKKKSLIIRKTQRPLNFNSQKCKAQDSTHQNQILNDLFGLRGGEGSRVELAQN